MISLLSRSPNYYDYAAHYSAGLIIPIIVSFSESLPKLKKWIYIISKKFIFFKTITFSNISAISNFIIISWVILFQIAVGLSPISRLFWSDKIWSINYQAYIPSERDAVIRNSITKYIPLDSSIIVSSQNNLNYSPLFLRQDYLIFPGGVTEPHIRTNWDEKTFNNFMNYLRGEAPVNYEPDLIYAEYVLIDFNRPFYLFDKGCDSTYLICRDKDIEKKYLNAIGILENKYILLFEYNGFRIFKKQV